MMHLKMLLKVENLIGLAAGFLVGQVAMLGPAGLLTGLHFLGLVCL